MVDAAVEVAVTAAQSARVDEVTAIVQQQYPQELHHAMSAVRSAKLGLQKWVEPTEEWASMKRKEEEESRTPEGQAKAKQQQALQSMSLFAELGLVEGGEGEEGGSSGDTERLWRPLMGLLQLSQLDYTIFWRELASGSFDVKDMSPDSKDMSPDSKDMSPDSDAFNKVEHELAPLARALECGGAVAAATTTTAEQSQLVIGWLDYLHPELQECWKVWLGRWRERVRDDMHNGVDRDWAVQRRRMMLGSSPKYVPREWMLMQVPTLRCQRYNCISSCVYCSLLY
jgi:uncharacterized protein YdiU (UPF0061 family)